MKGWDMDIPGIHVSAALYYVLATR